MTNYLIIGGLIAVFLFVFILVGYTKAAPDEAIVISGLRKKPRFLIGKAGFRIPFLERKDKLSLKLIQIDVKSSSEVPTADYINVRIDSNVNIKISSEISSLELAAQNFLNKDIDSIGAIAREVLEGNLREIAGTMKLEDMITNRQLFAEQVKDNAAPDLQKIGLEIKSFNIQEVSDNANVITNLGIDNISQISKKAAIAKAQADKDVATARAEAESAANEAQVKAGQQIAERETSLAIKKAELKAQADLKKAEADAAYSIKEQEQRKTLEAKTVEAEIAKAEQEVELNQKKAAVMEQTLDAQIKKKAEADKFAEQQRADADLYSRQREAEAKKYEQAQEAEAKLAIAKAEAEAKKAAADATKYAYKTEADGITAKGEAEAAAIRAKAEAEAAGTLAKAQAMKEYGDAAKMEMQLKVAEAYVNQIPQVAKALAEGFNKVGNITIYGEDSAGKFVGNMISSMSQLNDGLSAGMGLDIKGLLNSFVGGKAAGTAIASTLEKAETKTEKTPTPKPKGIYGV